LELTARADQSELRKQVAASGVSFRQPRKGYPRRSFAAFIAFHPGAELIERHRAEHPLAEHLERNSHGAFAALAANPGITLGLELGNGAAVCHPRKLLNRTRKQMVLQLGLEDRAGLPNRNTAYF
jgi:hypothetical protein